MKILLCALICLLLVVHMTPGFGADLIEKGFESLVGQDAASATFDMASGATITPITIYISTIMKL